MPLSKKKVLLAVLHCDDGERIELEGDMEYREYKTYGQLVWPTEKANNVHPR
jgi:hypothetical protein